MGKCVQGLKELFGDTFEPLLIQYAASLGIRDWLQTSLLHSLSTASFNSFPDLSSWGLWDLKLGPHMWVREPTWTGLLQGYDGLIKRI